MKNGSVNDFIDKSSYEECAVIYNGTKYFFHGLIYDKESKLYSYNIDVWDNDGNYVKTVFNKKLKSAEECLKLSQSEPVFEGKNFWEAEPNMEWIDW